MEKELTPRDVLIIRTWEILEHIDPCAPFFRSVFQTAREKSPVHTAQVLRERLRRDGLPPNRRKVLQDLLFEAEFFETPLGIADWVKKQTVALFEAACQ